MILKLLIIFIILSIISIIPNLNNTIKKNILYVFGFILIILAGFRGENVDRDYNSYLQAFYEELNILEPTFYMISSFTKMIFGNNVVFLFLIYSTLSISIKIYSIKLYSTNVILSLLIYFSYLFIIQDLTQIRAAVASSFLFLLIKPLYNRNYLKILLFSFCAILFHYSSALIVVILLFLNPHKINKWFYIIAIFMAYFLQPYVIYLYYRIPDLITFMPIQFKLYAYEYDNGAFLNIFNTWQVMRCFLSIIFLYNVDRLTKVSNYSILFIKLYSLSSILFVILSFNPSFSGRISDLLMISDIILLPMLINILNFKPIMINNIIIIIIAFTYFFMNVYYNQIILS